MCGLVFPAFWNNEKPRCGWQFPYRAGYLQIRPHKMRVLVFRSVQQAAFWKYDKPKWAWQFPYRAGCLEMRQYKMRVLVIRTTEQAAFWKYEKPNWAWQFKYDNIICVCWYSGPCSCLLSESTKTQIERDSFLPCRLLGNATIQNACVGIPFHTAVCFLKVRKVKMRVAVSSPCRLLASYMETRYAPIQSPKPNASNRTSYHAPTQHKSQRQQTVHLSIPLYKQP